MSDDQPQTPAEPVEPAPPTEAQAVESDRIARLRARSAAAESPASSQPDVPTPPPVEVSEPTPPAGATPPRFADPVAPPPAPTHTPAAVSAPMTAAPSDTPVAPSDAPVAPYDAPAGTTSARGWGSPPTVVAVAVALLAATATALAALVTSHLSSVNSVESTRSDVVGAATSGVATVLSYDYRHLDSDFARAERLLTPHFRKQYDDTTANGVKPLAAKYKAISSADVSAAGVVEADSDRAVVLVFVNQTVTNSQLTAPRLDRSRIDVTLVRSNGRWLIDKLTTL